MKGAREAEPSKKLYPLKGAHEAERRVRQPVILVCPAGVELVEG
jgi:hypothetical protein